MSETILKTKFVPPRLQQDVWEKSSLQSRFAKMDKYHLTQISAGPGSGKTTFLAEYFSSFERGDYAWYSLDEFDTDPSRFVQNFYSALDYHLDDFCSKNKLEIQQEREDPENLKIAIDLLINELLGELQEDFYVVLDDIHLISQQTKIVELLNYFINNIPPQFHLITAGRYQPEFPDMVNWQLKNIVYIIDNEDLLLEEDEVQEFFQERYEYELKENELKQVYEKTEGWIMALDLIGRRVSTLNKMQVTDVISTETESLQILFEYLTKEVIQNLSADTRSFLYKTSVLQDLEVEICNNLAGRDDSADILARMAEQSLFVKEFGENQFRYHKLFRDYLLEKARSKFSLPKLHEQAAEIYRENRKTGKAIRHYLQGEVYEQAAELIAGYAEDMLELGQIEALQSYLDELPQDIRQKHPELQLFMGDIYRAKNDFNGAMTLYKDLEEKLFDPEKNCGGCDEAGMEGADKNQNEIKLEVLKRLALVFLDTVQPAKADQYLQRARKMQNKSSLWQQEEVLRLLAENKINQGDLQAAEKFRKKADEISELEEEEFNLTARVQLRTGRLHQALDTLQSSPEAEDKQASAEKMFPRYHRETALLKSLIYTFLGREEKALETARQGLELIEGFTSPFTEAVARMRIGHALQLKGSRKLSEARKSYQKSLELIAEMELERGKCEPLMGLALLEAFFGSRELGEKYAREGHEIADNAGDEWLSGLLLIAMGINQFQQAKLQAARETFLQAKQYSQNSYDIYTRLICDYWLAIIHHQKQEDYRREVTLHEIIDLADDYNLTCLLKQQSLFTARDPDRIVPVLLAARDSELGNGESSEKKFSNLLAELGYSGLQRHPGYSLRIFAFGRSKFYRGREEITNSEWEREKARRLLLLFLIHLGEMLPRDKICSILWPDSELEKARSNFKVTLNSLKKTLEPEREPRQEPYFINRRGSYYGFNQEASYYYDVEKFKNFIQQAKNEQIEEQSVQYFQEAVELYTGDFLAEEMYFQPAREERENLRNKYLTAQHSIITYYFARQEYEKCIEHCNQALKIDICWEKAYYYLMKSYFAVNRRTMAIKTYQRCQAILQDRMGLEPGKEIEKLYHQITRK